MKARVSASTSGLDTDRELFEVKRKEFQRANRIRRRAFDRKTEKLLEGCSNEVLSAAIAKDRRRRQDKYRIISNNWNLLDPVAFTRFMWSYHDQNQAVIQMETFQVLKVMKRRIERGIRRSRTK